MLCNLHGHWLPYFCAFFIYYNRHGDSFWNANMELASRTVLIFLISSKQHYMQILRSHLRSVIVRSVIVIYLVMKLFNHMRIPWNISRICKVQNRSLLCFRSDLLTRGNRTNNFVEAQFLVLKDVILKRVKEYNVVALIGRITVEPL
jgi:hypothetical protein